MNSETGPKPASSLIDCKSWNWRRQAPPPAVLTGWFPSVGRTRTACIFLILVQELCESRGGRPGLAVLTSLMVSVDVKHYWTMLTHGSQLVPNMSNDIRGHEALLPQSHSVSLDSASSMCWSDTESRFGPAVRPVSGRRRFDSVSIVLSLTERKKKKKKKSGRKRRKERSEKLKITIKIRLLVKCILLQLQSNWRWVHWCCSRQNRIHFTNRRSEMTFCWQVRCSDFDMLLAEVFCFTSTETFGLLGTGAQDGHLHFHTASELWFDIRLLVFDPGFVGCTIDKDHQPKTRLLSDELTVLCEGFALASFVWSTRFRI